MAFNDKVVLITGASSGIGADAAVHLAKLGARVALVGRNEERLQGVAEQIEQSGSPAPLTIVADITEDTERIVDETIEHFGKLDVLVNNAGVFYLDNVLEMDMARFDRTIDVNVRSAIKLTKLCAPHLEKEKGNIVNVSSVAGLKPYPICVTYCISKAALDQFTKCAALNLAEKGIRVNSINASVIRTPIFATNGMPPEGVEQFYTYFEEKYPVGRLGEVADSSAAIAYLADNTAASFLTGINLPVDGGAIVGGT